MGELVAYLASEHGASINGATLPVDGSWTVNPATVDAPRMKEPALYGQPGN